MAATRVSLLAYPPADKWFRPKQNDLTLYSDDEAYFKSMCHDLCGTLSLRQIMNEKMLFELLGLLIEQDKPWEQEPPCCEEDIEALSKRIKYEFAGSLPSSYIKILSRLDGFEINGLTMFGSRERPSKVYKGRYEPHLVRGIVEANHDYRYDHPEFSDLLIFASRGQILYGQSLKSGSFLSHSVIETEPRAAYETFDHMMHEAIETALL